MASTDRPAATTHLTPGELRTKVRTLHDRINQAIDAGDVEGYLACLTEDVHFIEYRGDGNTRDLQGATAVSRDARARWADRRAPTVHRTDCLELTAVADDVWLLQGTWSVTTAADSGGGRSGVSGSLEDRFRCHEGALLLCSRTLRPNSGTAGWLR